MPDPNGASQTALPRPTGRSTDDQNSCGEQTGVAEITRTSRRLRADRKRVFGSTAAPRQRPAASQQPSAWLPLPGQPSGTGGWVRAGPEQSCPPKHLSGRTRPSVRAHSEIKATCCAPRSRARKAAGLRTSGIFRGRSCLAVCVVAAAPARRRWKCGPESETRGHIDGSDS